MPDAKIIEVTGSISEVFAHRFTIETADGQRLLADIGPHGSEYFTLAAGLRIKAKGEMKPSELKVTQIAVDGGPTIVIAHKPKHGSDAETLNYVTLAVAKSGYTLIGAPHRKPKHFEVHAWKDGEPFELHVAFDGNIQKTKPATSKPSHAGAA